MTDQSNNREDDKKGGKIKDKFSSKSPMGKRPFNYYWIYAIIAVLLISTQLVDFDPPTKEINLNRFEKMVADGDVDKLMIYNTKWAEVTLKKEALEKEDYKELRTNNNFLTGNPSNGPHFRFNIGPSEAFADRLKYYEETYKFENYDYDEIRDWSTTLGWIIPIGVMILIWIFIMRRMGAGGGPGGQIFNIGKSRATLFDRDTSVKVTFDDVAGLEGAKEEVQEIVDFLKNPSRYTQLGAHIPKGALLVGPPGTGKTLLAKAVAGEAQVPFFSLSGSDFVEMFVGVGASRVRDLFKQAKEKSPSIIFIDEIDAIGRARGKSPAQGANDERENTLNQLLTEMDGFGTNSGVIILGATNRADILDRALLRPGRFDRQIHVDMPDLLERKEIFQVHLKPIKLNDTVEIDFLAKQTPGFSGADIANICNEAALIAARKNKKQVDKQDFLDAVDRIIAGLEKKSKIITPAEKKVIAYHEAGHATASWLLEHASPLIKVTIVPRGKSLGAAWYLPEERQITTPDQMLDEMCAALGGRAAEEIIFNKISTGALSDLEKVTKQAHAMVSVYGLNDKIGNISYYDSTGQSEYSFNKPYSERTAQVIDEEVSKYIESAYDRAKKILSENKDKLVSLANLLLEKEVIFKEDLEKIFGARPFEKPSENGADPTVTNGKDQEKEGASEVVKGEASASTQEDPATETT
ncbi:MAG: ATP-dependent zinc metalloprotease FtsH [Salibacteraceae bacterium]